MSGMHIGRKLIDDNIQDLNHEYGVWIGDEDWELFRTPLRRHAEGGLDLDQFKCRQEKSVEVLHAILKRHEKQELVGFIAGLAIIEPRIQELQPWVRDHVVHAVNTFLVGAYVLKHVRFPEPRDMRYGYSFPWKLSGPTHDLGYPIEIAHNVRAPFIREMNEKLDELQTPSPRVGFDLYPENLSLLCGDRDGSRIIEERLASWGLGIDVDDYYLWLRRNGRVDHGVVGALAELKLFDALYNKYNPQRQHRRIVRIGVNFNQDNFEQDIVSACAALFVHNIDLAYGGFCGKISFQVAPLAFLLFLCDTFQEWDRYTENKEVYAGTDFDIRCGAEEILLYVPDAAEEKMAAALGQRLSGLRIEINGKTAVT
jgi:hypothetical protein